MSVPAFAIFDPHMFLSWTVTVEVLVPFAVMEVGLAVMVLAAGEGTVAPQRHSLQSTKLNTLRAK